VRWRPVGDLDGDVQQGAVDDYLVLETLVHQCLSRGFRHSSAAWSSSAVSTALSCADVARTTAPTGDQSQYFDG
jgi:hypothetical protein